MIFKEKVINCFYIMPPTIKWRHRLCSVVGKCIFANMTGNKQYEIANHLSNIMSTVSDRKIQVDNNSDGTVEYCLADLKSSSDYLPFVMVRPGRNFTSNTYRYTY